MKTPWLHELAALLELVSVLLAGALIYLKPELAPWPLLVAPVFWLLHLLGKVFGGWQLRFLAGLDGWVALFLASAGLALWASYDRSLGLTVFGPGGEYKFWLITAAALVYFAVARLPTHRTLWLAVAAFGWFGALAAGYFLLTHDFSTVSVKFSRLNRLGLLLQSVRPEVAGLTAGRALHPNVAGGLAALLFPLSLQTVLSAGRWLQGRLWRWLLVAASLAALLVSAVGILLSSSRGAWLGLEAALFVWLAWALLCWFLRLRGSDPAAAYPWRAGLFAVGTLVVVILVVLLLPLLLGRFPPFMGGENSLISRLDLMQHSLLLVQAAPFTGTGLGTFPMVYSTYVLLIHVPFISHAHNLFLNILLSQGWPGLLIFAALLLMALYLAYQLGRRAEGRWPLAGALAMLVVSLVHGLVDDPLYGSRAVLIWFVPLGLIAAAASSEGLRLPDLFATRAGRWGLVGAGAVVLVFGLLYRTQVAAAWEANLGLVSQARVELSVYDPDQFNQRTLDQLRQELDFSAAEAHFAQAQLHQPAQRTAGQQLAALALSRQQYEPALAYLEQLWSAGSRDRVTRLLYGSALVANGQPQAAAEVLKDAAWAEGSLIGEAWYRYYRNGDFRRAADAYRAVLFLNPTNGSAQDGLSEAEKRLP